MTRLLLAVSLLNGRAVTSGLCPVVGDAQDKSGTLMILQAPFKSALAWEWGTSYIAPVKDRHLFKIGDLMTKSVKVLPADHGKSYVFADRSTVFIFLF